MSSASTTTSNSTSTAGFCTGTAAVLGSHPSWVSPPNCTTVDAESLTERLTIKFSDRARRRSTRARQRPQKDCARPPAAEHFMHARFAATQS